MKNFTKNIVLFIFSSIIGFSLHRMLTADLIMNFFPRIYSHTWIHIMAIICQGIFIFALINLLIHKKISKPYAYILWGCYFCILMFIFFIRMVGMTGINLNPLDIIKNISADPLFIFTVIMNIFIFIPLGYLFRKKTFTFSLVSAFVISLCIEIIQYILKVGIFDIDDIIFNIIGFMIGCRLIKFEKL
ncbi:VanZ family protein [Clostridium sp. BJN0013]|uniref:VanZ family protein n=1 Tax=Clostridium sp. BJN0013 TaxID=3236840 RepID=UPI0034C5EAC2